MEGTGNSCLVRSTEVIYGSSIALNAATINAHLSKVNPEI